MNEFFTFILSCLAGTCLQPDPNAVALAHTEAQKVIEARMEVFNRKLQDHYYGRSLSANYLSGRFAQDHHDWDRAITFMRPIVDASPQHTQILNRAMVLAIGSGHMDEAVTRAKDIVAIEGKNNALATLVIALDKFHQGDYEGASEYITNTPPGGLSDFVMPLLEGWAQAAKGELFTENLDQNTIHLYHAILISEYLGQSDHIKYLLSKSLGAQGLSLQDLERIADVYAHIGETDTAIEIFGRLFEQWPENRILGNKLEALRHNKPVSLVKKVKTPEDGLARAMYDMSRLLFQEQSDESARVFAHMALFIDPELTNANLLLGYITARNKHYDDAITYYRNVGETDPQYAESIRMAADLMESTGKVQAALAELKNLTETHHDLEALIQIGDIHRRAEDYNKALKAYNKAADVLGDPIPREYWQLLYVRGITYERLGKWKQAEEDLQNALLYQPNHPMILNYIGYAWADQGINLTQALDYIRRAASLYPTDGYITDSLGWVLYRMGRYEEALPHLEHAVELLPYDSVVNDHLGDVYWQVGRRLEAKFQWQRAKNYSQDEALIVDLQSKLENGLSEHSVVQSAQSHHAQ